MKKYYLGVDLGSTTSKAIIINENDEIIGRGITNTRANYAVAADIAKQEAIYDARFSMIKSKLSSELEKKPEYGIYLDQLKKAFNYLQFEKRMYTLRDKMHEVVRASFPENLKEGLAIHINAFYDKIGPMIKNDYLNGELSSQNQFFRDVLGEHFTLEIEKIPKDYFEPMMLVFDKSITPVENSLMEFHFQDLIKEAEAVIADRFEDLATEKDEADSINFDVEMNILGGNYNDVAESLEDHVEQVANEQIHIANMVGTGYGRALLPFPEDSIKSEILCHAYGAHAYFPGTRTVLDIGGQDTKAIQVDEYGLVTSFHMNDRCAAGCGRYLGYIADEMNISLNELGPMALEATKEVNICSTCTVFAGAEIRELLNVGEEREDILAGLHKAIVMRALSLLARSGGVKNEFTFTGGVARNTAVLKYVSDMVYDNYGTEITINVHPDSIFMGALGGAMFARRNIEVELPDKKKKSKVKVNA